MLWENTDMRSSVTTIVLPAYLSYKALRTRDPAQIHPWLIYFTILSLALLFESWTLFIIGWIPFYSWLRLIFLLYLVLPQTQGAKILYLDYLEPYIIHHEAQIDNFIGQSHERLQQIGLGYIKIIVEYLRDKVLGQKSPQPLARQASYASYAQDLLSRFAMPSARTGLPADSTAGIYGMVSGLAGAAMSAGRTRDPNQEAASLPDSLVQDSLRGISPTEKSNSISAQRERLTAMLKALESEQQTLDLAYGRPSSSEGLKTKSKSEQSFEKVACDEPSDSNAQATSPKQSSRRATSGNWIPAGVTGWFAGGEGQANQLTSKGWTAARDITEAMAEGTSSSVDKEK
jgi:TB2/DP1, HVA22 family